MKTMTIKGGGRGRGRWWKQRGGEIGGAGGGW